MRYVVEGSVRKLGSRIRITAQLIDAVPGRLNQTWFKATREGVYYGQCRELCGKDHAFMPIQVRVASEADYNAWLTQAKQKFAIDGSRPANLAAAEQAKQ